MELSLVLFLNRLSLPYLDTLTSYVSNELFLLTFCLFSFVGIYFLDKTKRHIVIISTITALLIHFCITELLIKGIMSEFIFRDRPYIISPLIHQAGASYTDSSFPSSHMASTLSVLTVYYFFYRKYWPYMLSFILLMGFARIHNGMHYPTDVLFGSLFGMFYGMFSMCIVRRYAHPKETALS